MINWRAHSVINSFCSFYFYTVTRRFNVSERLFRSQETSQFGKNIGDTRLKATVPLFCPYTFWTHLWSITEQTHGIWSLFVKLTKKTAVSLVKKCHYRNQKKNNKLAWTNIKVSYGRIEWWSDSFRKSIAEKKLYKLKNYQSIKGVQFIFLSYIGRQSQKEYRKKTLFTGGSLFCKQKRWN